MKLNHAILNTPGALPGYRMPAFDRPAMLRRTAEAPTWLHFGSGNIFRMFPAVLCQRLLNDGLWDTASSAARATTGRLWKSHCAPLTTLRPPSPFCRTARWRRKSSGPLRKASRCRRTCLACRSCSAGPVSAWFRSPSRRRATLCAAGTESSFPPLLPIWRAVQSHAARSSASLSPAAWGGLRPAARRSPSSPWTTAPTTAKS